MTQIGRMVLKSSRTENIAPEDGIILGRALSMDCKRVAVARDTASSSCMMAGAVISGLLFQGVDVIDIGVVSAPAAAMFSGKADCTVYVVGRQGMVSGYYLLNPDGSLFRDEQIRHLDKFFQSPPERPSHEKLGRRMVRDGTTEAYNRAVMSIFSRETKCSIFLDCRYGTGSDSLPQILNRTGADVVAINAQRDPDYVGETDEMERLRSYVSQNPGSIGLILNRTGTAVDVVDETGNAIPQERMFALLVLYLRPSSIAVPVDSSSLLEDVFEKGVGIEIDTPFPEPPKHDVVLTRDNASAVCEAVSDGADLGYYHGSVIFRNGVLLGDGIRAATAIAQMAGTNSLHRITDLMPEYLREEKSIKCDLKADAFRHLFEENSGDMAGSWSQYGDSYRVVLDSGWFMLSLATRGDEGTWIEITAESKDRAYLAGLMELAEDLVSRMLRGLRSVRHDLQLDGLAVRIVRLPAGPVVGLARYEMDSSRVPEEVLVLLRRLIGESGMGMGGPRQAVVYGGHPLVQEAVGIPVDRAREQDHLGDHAVDLPCHAEELVRIGRPG